MEKEMEKENCNGKLEFEGDYLNGERNGKGKEYENNGILKYEGDYLNGYRNGKGKEYYDNGKLEFEGEYSKGKRWNGKKYNLNGNIEFTINSFIVKAFCTFDLILIL